MKIIKILVKSISLLFFTFSFLDSYAASIDHFKVTMSPENAKVGEVIDITIEAVDSNNNRVIDYNGAILIFSESDAEADFPNELKENSYTFKASDEGVVKFENAVKFQGIGIQDIHVYDLENDTIVGISEVTISGNEEAQDVEIEILSPDNGITIGEDKITISGVTNKNYNIIIKVNNNEIQTTSNGEGIFEETITGLNKGNNLIYAEILNSDGNVIGTSSEINIKIDNSKPRIKNLQITPEGELESEQKINIEVISNIGLSEVSVVINDTLIRLEEKGPGLYKVDSIAPKESGNYSIDIILKNEIGHETKELGVEIITIKEKVIKDTKDEPKKDPVKVKLEPKVEQVCKKDTKITGLKLTKLKTKSILNWDKVKDVKKYNIYKKLDDGGIELIKTVTKPIFSIDITGDELVYDFFAVKPVCDGEVEFEGTLSDATKIQTGPEVIILGLLSIIIGGLLVFYRRKA